MHTPVLAERMSLGRHVRRARRSWWLAWLLVGGLAMPGWADGSVDEIEACMLAQAPTDSSVQQLRFESQRKSGSSREVVSDVVWKRFGERKRMLARIEFPDDLRGSAILMIERKGGGVDLFTYLPELKKVRRITSTALRGNLFGSDFTYEDFQLLHGMTLAGETRTLPEQSLDGRSSWVLERRPAPESGSGYERVVLFIDKERCLLARAEMWEPDGSEPRKVLTADLSQVFEQDSVRILKKVELRDLRRGSRTRLELLSIDLDQPVRRRDLEVSALER